MDPDVTVIPNLEIPNVVTAGNYIFQISKLSCNDANKLV